VSTPGRSSGSDTALAWVIPGAAALLGLASLALWTGGGLASVLTGHRWPRTALSPLLVVQGPGKVDLAVTGAVGGRERDVG